jgi:cell volume regulation protein A
MMAQRLNLATNPGAERSLEHFDIDLPDEIQSSAREVEVTEDLLAKGHTLRELILPPHTLVVMVRRGEDFFVPTGASDLQIGDQLLVISDQDAEEAYRNLAAEAEEEALWRAEVRKKAKERLYKATAWMHKKK